MEDLNKYDRYIENKTPEEMHYSCLQWISYLDFIRDENKFFEDLLKEYTLPVLEAHFYNKAKELVTKLSLTEQQEKELTGKLNSHKNDLKYVIEGNDQSEEQKIYNQEHKDLNYEISHFTEKYRVLKKDIFEMVSTSLKKQKQNKLLS